MYDVVSRWIWFEVEFVCFVYVCCWFVLWMYQYFILYQIIVLVYGSIDLVYVYQS